MQFRNNTKATDLCAAGDMAEDEGVYLLNEITSATFVFIFIHFNFIYFIFLLHYSLGIMFFKSCIIVLSLHDLEETKASRN